MERERVQNILALIGLQRIFWPTSESELVGDCPFYLWDNEASPHTHGCFKIMMAEFPMPRYSCTCCGSAGSLYDLVVAVQAVMGRSFTRALALLQDASTPQHTKRRVLLVPPNNVGIVKVRGTKTPVIIKEKMLEFPLLHEGDSAATRKVARWLHHHYGISAMVIVRAKLRLYVHPATAQLGVLIPVTDRRTQEVTELWACLMDDPNPRKLHFGSHDNLSNKRSNFALYGLERLDKQGVALLVQSPLGALRCESFGLQNVIAVMGGGRPDMRPLGRIARVYLAMDEGSNGCKMTMKIMDRLPDANAYLIRWSGVRTEAGKVLRGSLDLESSAQFREIFERRVSFSRQHTT